MNKTDNQEIIIINENNIFVPNHVQMSSYEIADLFGVYIQTINGVITTILKSKVIYANILKSGTQKGSSIISDLWGLDMIVAIAFRIESSQAKIFRDFVIQKTVAQNDFKSLVFRVSNEVTCN